MSNVKTFPNEAIMSQVERMVSNGVTVKLRVKGYSMRPFIVGDRDSVTLERIQRLEVGDIVLAHLDSGDYVIHRIYAIDGDRITLMGDGNLVLPEYCSQKNVIGHVTTIHTPRKDIDPTSSKNRRLAALWRRLLPIRRYLLRINSNFYKLKFG